MTAGSPLPFISSTEPSTVAAVLRSAGSTFPQAERHEETPSRTAGESVGAERGTEDSKVTLPARPSRFRIAM